MLTHPRLAVIAHDLSMVALAWGLAILVRDALFAQPTPVAWLSPYLVMVLLAQGAVFWWTGLYRGVWRFASLPDMMNILKAVTLGTLTVLLALFLFQRAFGVPRTLLLFYPLVLFFLLATPRLVYRYWRDNQLLGAGAASRVLLLGAGRAGEMLVRDLKRETGMRPVGFLDDDQRLRGARIHGVPVLGGVDRLSELAPRLGVEMIIIAMPSATNVQMQRVVEACEATHLPFRTLPRLQDMAEGRLRLNDLKEVAIEDLLGRDPITLDWQALGQELSGRRVLVSGGGGSIGAELCRQIARLDPQALVVVEQSEINLFNIERELRDRHPDLMLQARLVDVCDEVALENVFARWRPEVVFHAAAYKHVPLLEDQVRAAVRNNVLGTRAVAVAAERHACEAFVLISTDKAVNPGNTMGMSKRVAEMICQSLAGRSQTRFITVRFGNVLNSAGSVVPLFQEQIAAGGPVTVTHPEVSRYFMTIPEASQLILQAASLGEGGEIFVLDMGEPVRIAYMAEQMIRLAGKVPGEDVEIVFSGLRPGEKLFEELFHEQESHNSTSHSKILLAPCRPIEAAELMPALRALEAACETHDEVALLDLLTNLVPEHQVRESEPRVIPLVSGQSS
jgi:FlaA1/EpsC-like NDP-sugar epimerase